MKISEVYSGYKIEFGFNKKIIDAIKAVPKELRRFDPADKAWIIKREGESFVRILAKRFGANVGVDNTPEMVGEVPILPEPSERLVSICQEQLKLMPYHYQLQGIEAGAYFMRFINGDEPGLGKTMQSIATVIALNAFPCLIVCPSTIKENWRREWSQKFTHKKAIVMDNSIKDNWDVYLRKGLVDVMIVNYESLKKYFVESITIPKGKKLRLEYIKFRDTIALFKSVVFDEIHKTKDYTTQQAKFSMGIARNKPVRIGLTGTPIVNKPKDLISQLQIIGRLEDFGGYKTFVQRYCDGGTGSSNLKELHWMLHTKCFFRRNKKDVLKDLPDRIRQVMICDISTRAEYNKAKNDFVKYLYEVKNCTDDQVAKKLRGQFMVQLGALKAISAKGKLDSVFEWADEIIESGEKVILFCTLREISDAVIARYGNKCMVIRGDVTGDSRQRAIDSFQQCAVCGIKHEDHGTESHPFANNDIKVGMCSIKAAGVGVTLTASSRVGFIEFPWTDADCDQCESRAHRNGQKDSVQCTYFLGDKTVDSYCYEIIKEKRSIAKLVAGQEEVQEEFIDNLLNIFNQE